MSSRSPHPTFDETTFKTPKHVYEFPKTDVKDATPMPPKLAAFLLEQVRVYGEASPELLGLIRAKRATQYPSSMGSCNDYRRELATGLRAALTCADRRALRHLAIEELGQPNADSDAVLGWLGAPE